MSWKDFFDKVKLADIQSSLKIDQGGIINVKVVNNHYHLHLPDMEAAEKLQEAKLTAEDEKAINDDSLHRLEYVASSLDCISDPAMREVVVATSTASAMTFVKKL